MMEGLHCFSLRLVPFPVPSVGTGTLVLLRNFNTPAAANAVRFSSAVALCLHRRIRGGLRAVGSGSPLLGQQRRAAARVSATGWFSGFGAKKGKGSLPEIMKAGDPVLQEPADEVPPHEIESERIQKIIDDMIAAMRKAPGVGLAAPQIGVPLKVPSFLFHLSFWILKLVSCQFFLIFSQCGGCVNYRDCNFPMITARKFQLCSSIILFNTLLGIGLWPTNVFVETDLEAGAIIAIPLPQYQHRIGSGNGELQ